MLEKGLARQRFFFLSWLEINCFILDNYLQLWRTWFFSQRWKLQVFIASLNWASTPLFQIPGVVTTEAHWVASWKCILAFNSFAVLLHMMRKGELWQADWQSHSIEHVSLDSAYLLLENHRCPATFNLWPLQLLLENKPVLRVHSTSKEVLVLPRPKPARKKDQPSIFFPSSIQGIRGDDQRLWWKWRALGWQ